MSTLHTPGPWELQIGEDYCFHPGNRCAITKSGEDNGEPYNVTIAELWPADNGLDIADARLIAAAPELKTAIIELITALRDMRLQLGDRVRLPNDTINHASYALKIGAEAIAKARGET